MGEIKYYLVRFDNEYILNSYGGWTLLKTEAGRLRPSDYFAMLHAMERESVSGELEPTSYKPAGTSFVDPWEWKRYHGAFKVVKGRQIHLFRDGQPKKVIGLLQYPKIYGDLLGRK